MNIVKTFRSICQLSWRPTFVLIPLFALGTLGCDIEKSPDMEQPTVHCPTKKCLDRAQFIESQFKKSQEEKGVKKAAGSLLYKNYLHEVKHAITSPTPDKKYEQVIFKYSTLLKLLQNSDAENFDAAFVYSLKETVVTRDIMAEFGELRLNRKGFEYKKVSEKMPWSGYWMPMKDKETSIGESSFLRKFDRLLDRNNRTSGATAHEAELLNFIEPDSWSGNCFGWAMAAWAFPEPIRPVGNLSVGEVKNLLSKASDNHPHRTYGIRYNGDAESDGTRHDLRPEAFQKVLTTLFNRGSRVVMDDDPGVAIWAKPIHSVHFKGTPAKYLGQDVMDVVARIGFVGERTEPGEENNRLTSSEDHSTYTYHYRLFFEDSDSGEPLSERVVASQWVKKGLNDSIKQHPDVLYELKNQTPVSSNEFLTQNMDIIEEISRKASEK